MINITFPDGAVREFEPGVTTFEIAQSISNSLAKKALAGKFNGKLIDTTRAITEDGSIEIVTPDHEDALPILRHDTLPAAMLVIIRGTRSGLILDGPFSRSFL